MGQDQSKVGTSSAQIITAASKKETNGKTKRKSFKRKAVATVSFSVDTPFPASVPFVEQEWQGLFNSQEINHYSEFGSRESTLLFPAKPRSPTTLTQAVVSFTDHKLLASSEEADSIPGDDSDSQPVLEPEATEPDVSDTRELRPQYSELLADSIQGDDSEPQSVQVLETESSVIGEFSQSSETELDRSTVVESQELPNEKSVRNSQEAVGGHVLREEQPRECVIEYQADKNTAETFDAASFGETVHESSLECEVTCPKFPTTLQSLLETTIEQPTDLKGSIPQELPVQSVLETSIEQTTADPKGTQPQFVPIHSAGTSTETYQQMIPSSQSYTNFQATGHTNRPKMMHSESMQQLIGEGSSPKKSILLRMPRFGRYKASRGRNVRFQELDKDDGITPLSVSLCDLRRSKTYGSVKLPKRKSKGGIAISDRAIGPWIMSTEDLNLRPNNTEQEENNRQTSAIHEQDLFLELLSKVQDNRYENQRYTLKAGSVNDPDESTNDDVFEESVLIRAADQDDTDTIAVNGVLRNGVLGSTSPELIPPSIEVSPMASLKSISSRHSKGPRHAVSMDSLDRRGLDHCRGSLSPPLPVTGSTMTPGRRSMEALKKVIESEGPYPLLIESPDGGYWVENGEYESAKGSDGIWSAPEISTEHYTVQSDLTTLAYGGHFVGQDHSNYIARDPTVGPVLLSLKFEKDYQGKQVRAILRTKDNNFYKVFPASQLPDTAEIPDYIRYISADKLATDKAYKIELPKAPELIHKFDEHPVAKTHKIGIIYQQYGQTSEEEMFGNVEHSDALDEFLTLLGSKVDLKGFEGYRGGLDVNNDQTGERSVHTTYKDREIMFHVSTLLPHEPSDTQHVQKKRHIGNDIVVIVFQEENTPFCPSSVRSHFIHSYIVVQVEHPNTDHTVYKVAVTAKDEVPQFGPPLPDPAVFQKGSDFREWLLTKVLNAEFNCHMAPSFKKLATRTRGQLFLHLVEEIAQSMDDVDYPSLTKGMVTSASGNDMHSTKSKRRRRRTLVGLFGTKKESQTSLQLSLPKRKSISSESPRNYRKLRSEPSSPREMVVGSTPDLAIASGLKEHSPTDYPIMINGRPSIGHATPDLGELSRGEGKGKLRRRFTAKKESEDRKRPKRTKSFGGASSLSDYFKKRKESTSPVVKRRPVKRESSEESSVSSSLNWSVPYDLPRVVDSEVSGKRAVQKIDHQSPSRCQSNPTILERKESEISVSDVCLTMPGKPQTADAAVQVTPFDWSNPFLTSFTTANDSTHNGIKIVHTQYRKSRSLQSTPKVLRKGGDSSSRYEVVQKGSGNNSPMVSRALSGEEQLRGSQEFEKRTLEDILKSIQSSTQSLERRGSSDREDVVIHRAESAESISTDVGELYDSVLLSLQSLTEDVVRLREQNTILPQLQENMKFASQNTRLKKHKMMKQLAITQKQITTLQLKLRLYQPNFPVDSEIEITSV